MTLKELTTPKNVCTSWCGLCAGGIITPYYFNSKLAAMLLTKVFAMSRLFGVLLPQNARVGLSRNMVSSRWRYMKHSFPTKDLLKHELCEQYSLHVSKLSM